MLLLHNVRSQWTLWNYAHSLYFIAHHSPPPIHNGIDIHHIHVLTPSEGHFQVRVSQCPGYAYTSFRKRPEQSSFSRYRYRYDTLLKPVYGMYVRTPPQFKICAMLARMLCDVYICYLEFSVLWIQHESLSNYSRVFVSSDVYPLLILYLHPESLKVPGAPEPDNMAHGQEQRSPRMLQPTNPTNIPRHEGQS